MLGVVVNFNQKDVSEVKGLLQATTDTISDFRPVWDKWEEEMIAVLDGNFEAQGTIDGAWKDISPKWRARKIAKGHDPRILIMTGAMRRAATIPGAPGNIIQKSEFRFYWGLDMTLAGMDYNYALVHDVTGGTPGIVREFMVLNREAYERLVSLLSEEVRAAIIERRRSYAY